MYHPLMSPKGFQHLSSTEVPAPLNEALSALEAVLRAIVDEPDQLVLTSEFVGDEIFLRVRSGEKEVGKLIGRQGRIARSLRIVLHAMTVGYKLTIHLDIDKRPATNGHE